MYAHFDGETLLTQRKSKVGISTRDSVHVEEFVTNQAARSRVGKCVGYKVLQAGPLDTSAKKKKKLYEHVIIV
jgi:hypothetical protein